jgi:hypothetical protein
MNYRPFIAIGVAALALSACGKESASGQPGPAFCEGFTSGADYIGGQLNCIDCGAENTAAAADGDLFSAAVFDTGGVSTQYATLTATAPSVFAPGGHAGVFLTWGADDTQHSLTINTLLEDVVQETVTGPDLTTAPTVGGTGAEQYVFFETTLEFDSVQIVLTSSGAGQSLTDFVYELCGHGAVQ